MRRSREYPEHPLVGVGGLIHRDGMMLLIKRRFEPNKGKWSLPGGLLEVGEEPPEAARREVMEELGLRVDVEELFQVANEVVRDDRGQVRYHFVLVDYLMKPLGDEINLNEESDEYGWFHPADVAGLDASLNTKSIALKFGESRNKQGLL